VPPALTSGSASSQLSRGVLAVDHPAAKPPLRGQTSHRVVEGGTEIPAAAAAAAVAAAAAALAAAAAAAAAVVVAAAAASALTAAANIARRRPVAAVAVQRQPVAVAVRFQQQAPQTFEQNSARHAVEIWDCLALLLLQL